MTDTVGVTNGRVIPAAVALPRIEHLIPDRARLYIGPVAMALLCVLGLALTTSRLGLLLDWSDRYDGGGEHVVSGCSADQVAGGDSWVCGGALVADGSRVDVRSDLVTSRGASASSRPFVGQRTEVFYDPDDLATVHPVYLRLNELARLYLSLLPRLLVVGGALTWLVGWALTRRVDATDLLTRDAVRLPGRFGWQRRGVIWLLVAAGLLVGNHFLTGLVLGSLGTF